MGRFTKRIIGGLAAALLVAGGAFAAQLLDDFDGSSASQNKLKGYWYFYSTGKSTVANAGPADEYGPMSFKSESGGRTGKAAVMKVGKLDLTDARGYPSVGMGTSLTKGSEIGGGTDFNNITGFRFWAKTDRADTTWVQFKVSTIENSDTTDDWACNNANVDPAPCVPGKPSESIRTANAYSKFIVVQNTWKEYTFSIGTANVVSATAVGAQVPGDYKTPPQQAMATSAKAGDLQQAGYWGAQYDFKKARITALQWQVADDVNKGDQSAEGLSLYLDDIYIDGTFQYQDPEVCLTCTAAPAIPSNGVLFSNFESANMFEDKQGNANERVNNRGYYWYMYDDVEAGGGSANQNGPCMTWDDYAAEETGNGDVFAVSGNGNASNGACIEYVMGPPFKKNGNDITPFVGIGTNLYDDKTTSDFLNASGYDGIYFELNSNDEISVEVEDSESIQNDEGIVYFIKIPATNGWKGVTIPFSKLVLPDWETVTRTSPLKRTELAKFQFKYSGESPTVAKLAIDNVYLYGNGVSVKLLGSSKVKATGLRATYSKGKVGVNWNAATSVASGKIQLVNTKGRVVASAPIARTAGKVTANLSTGTIPTGMYFVRVNAKDVNGKKIVQQVPVSVVK